MDRVLSLYRNNPDAIYALLALAFPIAASVVYIACTSNDSNECIETISARSSSIRSKTKSDYDRKYIVRDEGNSLKGLVTEEVSHGSWSMLGLERPLVIAMVGLPARGKSYIVKMLIRYLTWISYEAEVFNVGSYRRRIGLTSADSSFFNPLNADAARVREDMAAHVQDEMYHWLKSDSKGACRVAIFDATNTTRARRYAVSQRAREENAHILYVESICDDQDVLNSNYELKLQNEDYRGMDPVQARNDFMSRVSAYERVYESLEDDEDHGNISYLKLINVGQKTITRGCSGYLPSQVAFYLQNVHIQPRRIYFSLAAETRPAEDEPEGCCQITEAGRQYALDFANFFDSRRVLKPTTPSDEHIILCGTGAAATATLVYLQRIFPCFSTVLLNDLRDGEFEGLTKAEMKKHHQDEYAKRKADPVHYRSPGGGESYLDVVERTRPIVIELERQRKNVIVVAEFAVLKCLLAYFEGTKTNEMPKLRFKKHHIYELVPGPFGCTIRDINPVLES
jgi:broad specificity phosphatase PhoE